MVVVLHVFLKEKLKYGCCPADIFKKKNLNMIVVLLAFSKPRYGCCIADIFKIPNMVVVLLALLK